jgi:uncharacterized protein YdeI (YjbR/CyaY-like superfamily)
VKKPVNLAKTYYASNREDWRGWLSANYQTADEVWLVYYRKQSGKPRIPYNDAVEEALCFGWIDSITGGIDDDRYAQRFTPRKKGSSFSQTNIERLRRMVDQGKVQPEIVAGLGDLLQQEFAFPPDIMAELKANDQAWRNFHNFSGPYQRIRVAYIDNARKRPDEFAKRLRNFIQKTEKDKQFGFGIEAYY